MTPPKTSQRLIAVLAAGLALALRASAQAPSPVAYAVDVPLVEADGGMPCLQVQIADGTTSLFAFDTGNPRSVVDTQLAKSAGLVLKPLPAGMPADIFKTALPALHVGGMPLPVDVSLALDFVKEKLPADLGGTLGYSVFKDRVVQLDFPNHRFRISAPLTGPAALPGKAGSWSPITFGKKGPPIVVAHGFEVDGKPITAQVDTMYTGTTVIFDSSIATLGFSDVAKTSEHEFFALTDGGVNMLVVRTGSESFRGLPLGGEHPKLYFPTPGVHQPDGLFDATVGMGLLHGTVVTIDFHNMQIAVSGPSA